MLYQLSYLGIHESPRRRLDGARVLDRTLIITVPQKARQAVAVRFERLRPVASLVMQLAETVFVLTLTATRR